MCGICGFAGFEDAGLLRRMSDVLSHRGPDDDGFYTDGPISLGHRRLSIIDLDRRSRQPIHNEEGNVWVSFNGEIYNYLPLKSSLEEKGHRFYTESDTEVLVHLYEEYGEGFVNMLNGMFAFALWDGRKKALYLARDRAGKKPLYYFNDGGRLLFASEIKSLLEYGGIKREVNVEALNMFLALRFVPGPQTLIKGVHRLQQGHMLCYRDGAASTSGFWDYKLAPESGSAEHFANRLFDLTEESVRMRLMSDVPLGVFLSGGVDSGMITGLASKMVSEPLNTFSVGFEGVFDERANALEVSELFGTKHREIVVDENSMKELPNIIWHADEPIGDATNIPVYFLSKLARANKVPVILCGDGPDELYCGYEHYKISKAVDSYNRAHLDLANPAVRFALKNAPKSLLNRVFPYANRLGEAGLGRVDAVIGSKGFDVFRNMFDVFTKGELGSLLGGSYRGGFDSSGYAGAGGILEQILLFDFKVTLPDDFLMKTDKMGMAHSIEIREPHLDYRLIELASRIPTGLKLKGLTDKYVFRKAASKILPKQVFNRRKQRFFVPVDAWFTQRYSDVVRNLLDENPYFGRDSVDSMFAAYDRSPLYYGRQLWNMATFELWRLIFIEGKSPKSVGAVF